MYLCIHSFLLLFGSNSLLVGVLCLYIHVYILFACLLGLTPFLQVFCACLPTYTFYFLFLGLTPFFLVFYACIPTYTFFFLAHIYPSIHAIFLNFGSNSLLAGVLSLYTHICI